MDEDEDDEIYRRCSDLLRRHRSRVLSINGWHIGTDTHILWVKTNVGSTFYVRDIGSNRAAWMSPDVQKIRQDFLIDVRRHMILDDMSRV